MGKFAFEQDEEKKKAGFHHFVETNLPVWLATIEKRLETNTTDHYIVGDHITIADFALGGFVFSAVHNEHNPGHHKLKEVVENYPKVKHYF
jgi:glutathione S-transferase